MFKPTLCKEVLSLYARAPSIAQAISAMSMTSPLLVMHLPSRESMSVRSADGKEKEENLNKAKIYIAAPWQHKAEAKVAKEEFEAAGYITTSNWITKHEDKPADQSGLNFDLELLQTEAKEDVKDVFACDILVLLNSQKRGEETSGKAVEMGLAMAWLKPVIVVGSPTNIFHMLETIPKVTSVADAISLIHGWEIKQSLII